MSAETATRAFAPFEWMVALRYLRARRKEGFISVIAGFSFIGIMLGVATLIIVMAVMNGFRQELFNKMLGLNGHVVVHSLANFADYDNVADRVRAVPGVKFALPLVEGQVMISTPSNSTGALVRGLREADLKQLKAISDNIRFGTLDGFDKAPGLALGTRLANELNVKVGDEVSLLTPRGAATALGTAPRVKRYPVVAIFEIGMSEYDASILFMPLNEAQLYFNQPGTVPPCCTSAAAAPASASEAYPGARARLLRRRGQGLRRRAALARRRPAARYVQMDDTNLAYLCDEKMREARAPARRRSRTSCRTATPSSSTGGRAEARRA